MTFTQHLLSIRPTCKALCLAPEINWLPFDGRGRFSLFMLLPLSKKFSVNFKKMVKSELEVTRFSDGFTSCKEQRDRSRPINRSILHPSLLVNGSTYYVTWTRLRKIFAIYIINETVILIKKSQIRLEISKKKKTLEKWAKATDRRKWTIKGKSSALKVTGEIQIKIKELLYFCITLETITRSKTSRVGSDVGKQTLWSPLTETVMSMRGRHATIHRLGKSTQCHATFGTAALVVPALLLTVNNWKSHKSPSTREWIRKLSHVYATGY